MLLEWRAFSLELNMFTDHLKSKNDIETERNVAMKPLKYSAWYSVSLQEIDK